MAGIADIRAKFPQYSDMSDAQLADAVHKKFYADMPKADFDAKLGIATDPNAQAVAAGVPVADPNAPGADGNSNAPLPPMMMYGNNTKGLLTPGNTDLNRRPIVKNPDGSISTVRSMSFRNNKGQEVLIPTVADDGSRILSIKEAKEQYGRTGKHLGIFDNPDDATAYAESLHEQQDQAYAGGKAPTGGPSPAFQNALAQLHAASSGIQQAPQEDTDRLVRANLEASKIQQMQGDKGLMGRAAEAIPGGATGGFADEIYSGTVGGLSRMLRDQVGYGEAYKREQALAAAQKRKRGDAANIIGDVAGGLATGGTLANGGVTLTGRSIPYVGKTLPAMAEGAAYGGVYGAGNAEEGHRLEDAGWGALTGAATGGALELGGRGVSRLITPKQALPAPGTDELATASRALYEKARQSGVAVKPQAFDNLANNMQMAAGRPNPNLRPNTSGIVDDVLAMKGKPVDLEALDELRQSIRLAGKNAQPQDKLTLDRMTKVIDNFSDKVGARDITGDIKGFEHIKEARKLWSQKSKAQTIEDLLDLADVDTGKYTQSGMANTIRQRMAQLYTQIKKGKTSANWSKDEVALIRQMAKGGSNSQMVNWLAKLAPRGVISASLPQMAGATATTLLGPAGLVINAAAPIAGSIAGRAADRGALTAANSLRDAAARGFVQQLPQLANHLRPAIGGATAGAVEMRPRLLQGN